jgi:hypothetical protein
MRYNMQIRLCPFLFLEVLEFELFEVADALPFEPHL